MKSNTQQSSTCIKIFTILIPLLILLDDPWDDLWPSKQAAMTPYNPREHDSEEAKHSNSPQQCITQDRIAYLPQKDGHRDA
jgi:hypothetical protein